MIICQCAQVNDAVIRRLVEEGATTVSEITRACGAGQCCLPCRDEIATIIYGARTVLAAE